MSTVYVMMMNYTRVSKKTKDENTYKLEDNALVSSEVQWIEQKEKGQIKKDTKYTFFSSKVVESSSNS